MLFAIDSSTDILHIDKFMIGWPPSNTMQYMRILRLICNTLKKNQLSVDTISNASISMQNLIRKLCRSFATHICYKNSEGNCFEAPPGWAKQWLADKVTGCTSFHLQRIDERGAERGGRAKLGAHPSTRPHNELQFNENRLCG